MKMITAVIRPEKLEVLKASLEKVGYPGMMVTEIRGHGRQGGVTHSFRGNEFKSFFLAKTKVDIVVQDSQAKKLIDSIVDVCRSGSVGDGKIFITDIKDAVRIRTGESGDSSL